MANVLLPLEIICEIINCLNSKDAVSFARSNKQMLQDACRSDFGYRVKKTVKIHDIFNTKKGNIKHQYVIGYFDCFMVQSIDELTSIPESTKKIMFDHKFNQTIRTELCRFKQLTHLIFGVQFTQSVDDLKIPCSLTHLKFGHHFNQPIDKLELPNLLTHLEFGDRFNQSVDHIVSESLTHLTLCYHFSHPLFQEKGKAGIRVSSLTHLITRLSPSRSMNNLNFHLCNSLKYLTLCGWCSSNRAMDNLKLPNSLTHLDFGNWFDEPVDNLHLPNSLTHLDFGNAFNRPIDNLKLPDSLTHLNFGNNFRQSVDNLKLPDLLTYLNFGNMFPKTIENLKLPDSLIYLNLGLLCDRRIDYRTWPTSLKCINFGRHPETHKKNLSFFSRSYPYPL